MGSNLRLSERFALQQSVLIYFEQIDRWVPGRVVRFDYPGVWVETAYHQQWFVTNGRRIRPLESDGPE